MKTGSRAARVALPAFFLALAGTAFGQGSDSCAGAQPIAGLGTFAFDNRGATTDGPADCSGALTHKDVWFRWTAPATDDYKLTLCGGTTLSTRAVVYAAGSSCGSLTVLNCAAGNCTLQSYVNFSAVAGQDYLLRIGSRQSALQGAGTFAIEHDPCPSRGDDSLEQNDSCAAAVPMGDGTTTGLIVHKFDEDWYEIPVQNGGTLTVDVFFTHATGDIDIYLYRRCGDPAVAIGGSATDDEQVTITNTTGCLQFYKLRVIHYVPDAAADCNDYDMTIAGSGTGGPTCDIGTNYCRVNPNSTGAPAIFTALGSASVAANDVTLQAAPVPNQPYIFFFGPNPIEIPFGNGFLCVGGGLTRILPPATAFLNRAERVLDLPTYGIAPGTLRFQCWFRDPAGGGAFFNLSDGYVVTFVP